MAQFHSRPNFDQLVVERVIGYLQTKDPRLFPFTAHFDEEQRRAFIRDLRDGLADLTDSGSARKTSATGHIMSDARLLQIIREWTAAGGGWPRGSDPRSPDAALLPAPEEPEDIGMMETEVGPQAFGTRR